MPTQVATGASIAIKQFSVALFAAQLHAPSFRKKLKGPVPKQANAEAKLKGQSSPDMPIVECRDLTKSAGEKITVDMVNIIGGKPIMGDRRAKGSGEGLTFSTMECTINQYRKVVDRGGKMAMQRTKHNLRTLGGAALMDWFNRYEDQACLVHYAGARGTQDSTLWTVPLASDPDYAEILINTVRAPSYNRHFVADGTDLVKGGAQLASIDSTDILKLEHIDYLRTWIDNLEYPMQAVKLPGDEAANDEPLFVLMVTASQYSQLLTNTSGAVLRTFQQNAWNRATNFKSAHPLFKGEVGMWNGILVKKMGQQVIRFAASEAVPHVTVGNRYTATETNVTVNAGLTAGFGVERALLLGAQGLIDVYGRQGQSDYYYAWMEEGDDFENNLEICGAGMGGKSKVRFSYLTATAGVTEPTDHGVAVIDTAVKLT